MGQEQCGRDSSIVNSSGFCPDAQNSPPGLCASRAAVKGEGAGTGIDEQGLAVGSGVNSSGFCVDAENPSPWFWASTATERIAAGDMFHVSAAGTNGVFPAAAKDSLGSLSVAKRQSLSERLFISDGAAENKT